MARAMWSGVISFGMVTIPVKLYTATESHNISFHLLHEKCDTRIKEQRFCPHCDKTVEWGEIVKGYEYSKDKYIEISSEDLEKLPLPSKRIIDVASFVDRDEIDPIYFDATYFVSVDEKGAQKPYKLLMQSLESRGVVGIATITFRTKERMCAISVLNGKLVLQTLLYSDEIKKNESESIGSIALTAQEKKMADSLVEMLHSKFEPDKFKDKYQAALKKLIQAKLKGVELKEVEVSESTQPTDLMEALRASIEKARGNAHRAKSKMKDTGTKKRSGGTRRKHVA